MSDFATFCYNVEGAHDIKSSQKQFELKFCRFRRLGSNFTRGSHQMFYKKTVLKNFTIFTEQHQPQSPFLGSDFIKKETLTQGFCCKFFTIFKNAFFTEYLWLNVSILQQLLTLYFVIIYSWQVSNSEKTSVGKKNLIHVSQGFYRFIFLLHMQSICCILSSQDFLVWRHLNTMLLTNFENLNSISKIFLPRKTQFLSFDRPSNYLYLFKNHRRTVSYGKVKCHFKVVICEH